MPVKKTQPAEKPKHNGHKPAAEAILTAPAVPVAAPAPEPEEVPVDFTDTPEFQEAVQEAALKLQAEMSDGQKAKLKLVNMVFDTPEGKLGELTIIPRQLIMWLVYQICLEAYGNPKRDPVLSPISKIQRIAFFQLMRSVNGQHLIRGAMLAENELKIQEEEGTVPEKW